MREQTTIGFEQAGSTWLGCILVLVIATALSLTGCSKKTGVTDQEDQRVKPDIILISIDTLRADHLGCYGRSAARTPNMDRLAQEGTLFEAASTTVPVTLPAHTSLLTGLIPPRHQVRDNGQDKLTPSFETLAEVLQGNGYQTAAFIGAEPLNRGRGLAQGFDVYDDRGDSRLIGGSKSVKRPERYAEEVAAQAAQWIKRSDSETPIFAFVHFFDPHSPYEKALPDQETWSYDGEIAFVDRVIGKLLNVAAEHRDPSNRLIIVTSDHGEGLGEHREKTHCIFVYDSTLRIPLILNGPGIETAKRIDDPVSIVDVAPTIVDLVGVSGLEDSDGISLVSTMRGNPTTERDLYFESLYGELRFGWAALRGIRRGSIKFIDAPNAELFDLDSDPRELNNLFKDDNSLVGEFEKILDEIGEGSRSIGGVDDESVKKLATLGYVAARPLGTDNDQTGPDPKDRIEVYDRFQSVYQKFFKGAQEEALELMSSLEPYMSTSPHFYSEWGFFQMRSGKWKPAIASYSRCLELTPDNSEARYNMSVAQVQTKAFDEAQQNLKLLLSQQPEHVNAHLYSGLCAKELGNLDEAVIHWRRFVELAPNHPEAAKIRIALDNSESKKSD